MDQVETLAFARALIDIDSTTGREHDAGDWLATQLRARGYTVTEQPVGRGCSNIIATLDPPAVVFSTHFDCVPPFFPSEVQSGRLYGRGACDAKGILAAQVAAADRLRLRGERRVGLLYVVGEERGSDGAAVANRTPSGSKYLINGEPTDSKLALGTRGVLRVKLTASGKAAHSAAPDHGVSAIEKLVDALVRLRSLTLPSDPDLGVTFYTVGLIEGGVAPNVIPAHAWAEVNFRTIGNSDEVLKALEALKGDVAVDEILRVPLVRLHTVAGFQTAAFPFTTDIPFLDRWGTPLLFGPGSFLVAHTDHEHVELEEMYAAVDAYERLATALLS